MPTITKKTIHEEFDNRYLLKVFEAYPNFTESHKILLEDIKYFYDSKIQQLLVKQVENLHTILDNWVSHDKDGNEFFSVEDTNNLYKEVKNLKENIKKAGYRS